MIDGRLVALEGKRVLFLRETGEKDKFGKYRRQISGMLGCIQCQRMCLLTLLGLNHLFWKILLQHDSTFGIVYGEPMHFLFM